MARGLAYDSDEGRDYAAALTSILSGESYAQSARISAKIGPFDGYAFNEEPFLRVIDKHRRAAYRMNTRPQLRRLFARHGFREAYFAHLPDCRTTFRFRLLHGLELLLWRALDRVGVTYPENCLLGIYERV